MWRSVACLQRRGRGWLGGWPAESARWRSTEAAAGPGRDHESVIRNFGIMAHVDAGKTTASERMLFNAGITRKIGNVDDGDTVMDYLPQERERGITISSAAISFPWKGYHMNLIDTPGHVDFSFEVERCLRVLDGAVAIFDGTTGVEAQSVAVWKQADRFGVPRISFVNKMDRPSSSVMATVESMRHRLHATPLLTQLPSGVGRDFRGVLNLVTMELLIWPPASDSTEFTCKRVAESEDLLKLQGVLAGAAQGLRGGPALGEGTDTALLGEAIEARARLAEEVVTLDPELLQLVLEEGFHPLTLAPPLLARGINRLCRSGAAVPVLCGSASHNVGLQPLVDAVVEFLPPPSQASIPTALRGFFAYAFKVQRDPQRGLLVFLRLYSGSLTVQSSIHNASRDTEERVMRLLSVAAGELREVSRAEPGSIVIAVGLKNTFTGDSLVQSAALSAAAHERGDLVEGCIAGLASLQPPPPAFSCSVEPASLAGQRDLQRALDYLVREDPSLHVAIDTDTGQTVLSGMGRLHLEVAHNRLSREFGVSCSLGQLQLAYRESLVTSSVQQATVEQSTGSNTHSVCVRVRVGPADKKEGWDGSQPHVFVPPLRGWEGKRRELCKAVREAVEGVCMQGPLLAYPLQGVLVEVEEVKAAPDTPLSLLAACVAKAVSKALAGSEVALMEPFAAVEVEVSEEQLAVVLADLGSARRARVRSVQPRPHGETVSAFAPIATLTDYSTILRTLTSGTASFSSAFSHYEPLSPAHQEALIAKNRGYSD